MPVVRKPQQLPSPLDYVPPNSVKYRVTGRDSWYSLACRPEMKNAKVSASDLCFFNFRTRKPEEINWYLYHKVGCRQITHDHSNYKFSEGDKPGIVYLPKSATSMPAQEKKEEPRLNAWLGIVGKAGTMFAVVGIETVAGAAISLDAPDKWMTVNATVNRVGAGWGATLGASFVFITGVSKPEQLNGWQQGDKDFNLALGENWGKMAKSSAKFKKLQPVIQAMAKLGAKTPSQLKCLLKTKPDHYVDLVKAVKSVKDYGGLKKDGDPEVFMWDIPWVSGGAEVSCFYGISTFSALWDNTQ